MPDLETEIYFFQMAQGLDVQLRYMQWRYCALNILNFIIVKNKDFFSLL